MINVSQMKMLHNLNNVASCNKSKNEIYIIVLVKVNDK